MLPLLDTRTETLTTGSGASIVRLVFAGEGGSFSAGHHHGHQMTQVLKEVIERHSPCGIIIDVQDLIYRGGDWIAWGALQARTAGCQMCLAVKPSMEAIRELWDTCKLGTIIPVFPSVEQATAYLLSPEVQEHRKAADRSRIRSAYLKVERGGTPGTTFELVEEKTVIGRHPTCNLVLDSATVARKHAAISRIEGAYLLEDQLSQGGTMLNGERIAGPTGLKNGDLIRLGGCELSFHESDGRKLFVSMISPDEV